MASATMKAALRSIDDLLGGGAVAGLSDGELLGRFAADRDESAFAALVARHGPMVLATALGVARDPDEAEDVFQAAFLMLARRAGSIRDGEALAGWLRRVARRAAVRANVQAARRRDRDIRLGPELALRARPEPLGDDEGPAAIRAEVDRLPDALRRPVVLCDLEGLTRPEAARRLGWTEGAVRGRLARARSLLRSRLTRRGLAPPSAFPVFAVPPAWSEAAVRGAIAPAGGPAGALLLASAVARGMILARLRAVAAFALLTLVAGSGIQHFLARSHAVGQAFPPARQLAIPAGLPAPPDDNRDAPAAEGAVTYTGRVVDPRGRPFAGARVYLDYFRLAKGPWFAYPPTPRRRATSGPDGRFRFSVAKAEFHPAQVEPWRRGVVVALAEGFGLGLSDSDEADSDGDRTIRLAPDDAPLTGRVLDLEGRPVAGVSVLCDQIWAPSGPSLTPWVEAGRENGRETLYDLQHRLLKKELRNDAEAGPIRPAVTGPDGRFRLVGIGRERVVALTFEGPTIRTMQARAMTRPGEPVRLPHFFRAKDPLIEVYRPAGADYVASPTRPHEGVVRDKDTGEPIAGVSVESYRFADGGVGNVRNVRATTDALGKFRLVGMPRGLGNEVYVIPPGDRPYFPTRQPLPDAPGLGPIAVEFALKRGVWLRGRLADAATGRPARGSVSYHVAADNPHLADLPGFREINLNGDYTFLTPAEADGTFRVAALPGRGLVVAEAGSQDYLGVNEDAGIEASHYVPQAYRLGDALAEVELPEAGEPAPVDLAFRRARQVAGTVLDPDGRPLGGARAYGLYPVGGWFDLNQDSAFLVRGLRPPRFLSPTDVLASPNVRAAFGRMKQVPPRVLVFRHDARGLAGSVDVRGNEDGPIAARLRPWAVASGRLVDADGQARAGVALRPQIADKPRFGEPAIDHDPRRIVTGPDGRFRLDGLVPGLAYHLYHEDPATGGFTFRFIPVPAAEPGATTDLGDVR